MIVNRRTLLKLFGALAGGATAPFAGVAEADTVAAIPHVIAPKPLPPEMNFARFVRWLREKHLAFDECAIRGDLRSVLAHAGLSSHRTEIDVTSCTDTERIFVPAIREMTLDLRFRNPANTSESVAVGMKLKSSSKILVVDDPNAKLAPSVNRTLLSESASGLVYLDDWTGRITTLAHHGS